MRRLFVGRRAISLFLSQHSFRELTPPLAAAVGAREGRKEGMREGYLSVERARRRDEQVRASEEEEGGLLFQLQIVLLPRPAPARPAPFPVRSTVPILSLALRLVPLFRRSCHFHFMRLYPEGERGTD